MRNHQTPRVCTLDLFSSTYADYIFFICLVKLSPLGKLFHGSLLIKSLVHIERLPQQVWLVEPSALSALKLSLGKVILQQWAVLWVGTLGDDNTGTLLWRQATDISKTLLSNDNIQIVLSLVNVGGHWDNAGDSVWVDLGWTGRWSVHDGVLGVSQEIGGSTDAVEHAGTHDTGGVGVGVNIDLNWGVHADNTKTLDDLWGVRDLLGAEEELVVVVIPVVVKALESVWGETDGGGGSEVELSGVEKVEEGILENLSPDAEVLEVGVGKSTNDGVGDITDTRLEWEEVSRETAVLNLVLEELNEVTGDGQRVRISWSVVGGLILVVRLDDTDDLLGVDWDVSSTNTVLWCHDEVWLAAWWVVHHGNIVETLERWHGSVDLNDDLRIVLVADSP